MWWSCPFNVACVCSNAAYAFLLDDKARSRVEARGRVELSGPEAAALSASKNVHATLVIVAVLLAVWIAGSTTEKLVTVPSLVFLPFGALCLSALADAGRPTAAMTAKVACRAAGEALVGFIGWVVLCATFIVTQL